MMGKDEVEQECLTLLSKAQELIAEANSTHDKNEKRRLKKEARNLEKLAEDTMKKYSEASIDNE